MQTTRQRQMRQGTRPVVVENCTYVGNASNTKFANVQGASAIAIHGMACYMVPSGCVLTNQSVVDAVYGIYVLSGSGTYASFVGGSRPQLAQQAMAQNMLPIGPTGVGSVNFTNNGFSAKTDVASAVGLAGNAMRFTLSGSGNAAYYSLPAKLVQYLQGKTVTLVAWGYQSVAGGGEYFRVAAWDSVGSPAFGNQTADGPGVIVVSSGGNSNLQCAYVSFTVGASATSLAIGFAAGGGSAGATVSIESMRLLLGYQLPDSAGLV